MRLYYIRVVWVCTPNLIPKNAGITQRPRRRLPIKPKTLGERIRFDPRVPRHGLVDSKPIAAQSRDTEHALQIRLKNRMIDVVKKRTDIEAEGHTLFSGCDLCKDPFGHID